MPIYPNSELLGEQNIEKIEVNENIKNKEEAKEEIKRLVELVIDLEEKNLIKEMILDNKNIFRKINENEYIFLTQFNQNNNVGTNFTLENFRGEKLNFKIN